MNPRTRKQRGGINNFLHEVIRDKNLAICSVKEKKKSSVEKLGRFHWNAGVTWLALRWDLNTVVLCAAAPRVPTSFMEFELQESAPDLAECRPLSRASQVLLSSAGFRSFPGGKSCTALKGRTAQWLTERPGV